jgi:hypothetical protein
MNAIGPSERFCLLPYQGLARYRPEQLRWVRRETEPRLQSHDGCALRAVPQPVQRSLVAVGLAQS